jgi:hypothetical protein
MRLAAAGFSSKADWSGPARSSAVSGVGASPRLDSCAHAAAGASAAIASAAKKSQGTA